MNESPDKIVTLPKLWLSGAQCGPELEGCDDAHDYPGFEKIEDFPTV
ncbi:MAG: hypothetical protein AAF636_20235 [Pseudomonadota bacterium]